MSVFINPGSGPVDGATAANARDNINQFCKDLRDRGVSAYPYPGFEREEIDGRWTFKLIVGTRSTEVAMPGLPGERVRWLDEPGQNIWDFPRLYVDGSSWVWQFALNAAAGD